VIETFVSRPNWVPQPIEERLAEFYQLLEDAGFKANTVGKSEVPLRSPFEDVRRMMEKCQCTIVLGLPQIFMHSGTVKHVPIKANLTLPTEWNQIEATMSLMLDLPTLVLLHKTVASRGIFDRGAANVFVHEFSVMEPQWLQVIRPALTALRNAIDS
jgi:hypothetical protein